MSLKQGQSKSFPGMTAAPWGDEAERTWPWGCWQQRGRTTWNLPAETSGGQLKWETGERADKNERETQSLGLPWSGN